MTDKQKFLKEAVILCDSREQQNRHILDIFNQSGVKYEVCKLWCYTKKADRKKEK